MTVDADVLVIGAGPSGCATAYDLAETGHSVLLLDHRSFPRLKPCGGALTAKTLLALRFSVEPVINHVIFDFVAGKGTHSRVDFKSKHPLGAMTIRTELDEFVLMRTLERGVRLEKIGRITGIMEDHNGVTLHTVDRTYRSKFLVGADGTNSTVRKLTCQFDESTWGFAIEGHVNNVDFDTRAMEFDFGVVDRGYGWVFPKRDHLNVGVYTYDRSVALLPKHLQEYVSSRLGPAEVTKVVGHPIAFGSWRYHPTLNRILLVGDAAGLCEPLLGEGIFYAVKSGQAAASAIHSEQKQPGTARTTYARRLRYLQMDNRMAYATASQFYQHLDTGYRLLTTKPIYRCLLKGYAAGVPIGEIERTWFSSLPFRPIPKWSGA